MSRLERKIVSLDEAASLCKLWQESGEKVVFTNGVFDLIHPGHVLYLEEAKSLGSKLILGLNSDSSARQLEKGVNRPINDETARAIVMAAFESIDAIVVFGDSTPEAIIKTIVPNVLAKGGDYKMNEVAGGEFIRQNGGEVRIIPFVEGYSTTAIEQRILKGGGLK